MGEASHKSTLKPHKHRNECKWAKPSQDGKGGEVGRGARVIGGGCKGEAGGEGGGGVVGNCLF